MSCGVGRRLCLDLALLWLWRRPADTAPIRPVWEPPYATVTATPDPSHVCDLHRSSQQCWILNPLSEARDWTCNLMVPSWIRFRCATMGTPESHVKRKGIDNKTGVWLWLSEVVGKSFPYAITIKLDKNDVTGVPIVTQWKWIRLVSMRTWIQSLASLSGLRFQHCRELWCRSQMQLGSGGRPAATALIRPLAWEPPYATGVALKKKHTHTHTHTKTPSRKWKDNPKNGEEINTCKSYIWLWAFI